MIYEFEVPGKVVGKGRPRINTNTGITYTPTSTKDYETLIQQYFLGDLKYLRTSFSTASLRLVLLKILKFSTHFSFQL